MSPQKLARPFRKRVIDVRERYPRWVLNDFRLTRIVLKTRILRLKVLKRVSQMSSRTLDESALSLGSRTLDLITLNGGSLGSWVDEERS